MRRKKKFLLEKDVQETVVKFARKHGWWARKFSSPANRSVPDYLFAKLYVLPAPDKLAMEFKKPGGKPTPAQLEEIKAMRAAGWDVYVVDDIEVGKAILASRGIGWLE